MNTLEDELRIIIRQSPGRLAALETVRALNLPQGAIGAGFIRAAVWDHLTGRVGTPVDDIDVIYCDASDFSKAAELAFEAKLRQMHPGLEWSVRNQVRMAARNGDRPYTSLHDALCHWLETPTCIAVHVSAEGEISITAPYGLEDLFAMRVRPTPRGRERSAAYRKRIIDKRWQDRWPGIIIELP